MPHINQLPSRINQYCLILTSTSVVSLKKTLNNHATNTQQGVRGSREKNYASALGYRFHYCCCV